MKNKFYLISLLMLSLVLIKYQQTAAANSENLLHSDIIVLSLEENTKLIDSLNIDHEAISILQIITPDQGSEISLNDLEINLKKADAVFIDRFLPSNTDLLHLICEYVNGTQGKLGMVLFGILSEGNGVSESDFSFEQVSIIQHLIPVTLYPDYQSSTNDSTSIDYKVQTKVTDKISTDEHYITRSIPWESCPALSYRTLVDIKSGGTAILRSIDDKYALISEWTIPNGGEVMFFSMEIIQENLPFTLWPYFNYMIYATALHITPGIDDADIPIYSKWDHAPLPSARNIVLWFILIAGMWVVSFYVYFYMKKRTANDPNYTPEKLTAMKNSNPLSTENKILFEEGKPSD